jgi:hypothetical protein
MSDELRPGSPFRLVAQYGLNENPDPDIGECTIGYNFDIAVDQSWFIPRDPFDLKGTAPNAGIVTGIMQLVTRIGTQSTLVCAGTTIYLWDGGSTWTSKASVPSGSLLRDMFWPLGDYSLITDVSLQNVLLKWDGTTISNAPTGLGGTPLYAKYGVVHQNRVWLFNVTTNTTTPHLCVASAFEDPTTFNITNRGGPTAYGGAAFATGTEAFYMTMPDLRPINGVAVFQNSLIVSTLNGRMFQLTGSSAKDFQWVDFFDGSPSVGSESIANIGNDVVFMRSGGHINLMSATQNFGNARTDELTRWLKSTISNLSGANQIIYDIANQKVLFFISGKVMVLFKDFLSKDNFNLRGKPSPWSIYTTQHPNSFNTQAAKYMLIPNTTNYSVYWGDSNGNVFDINGSSAGGDAATYPIMYKRRSRHIGPEMFNGQWPWAGRNIEGSVEYRRIGPNQVSLSFDWDDEYNTSVSTISLRGPSGGDSGAYFGGKFYFGGPVYFNQGFSAVQRLSDSDFSPSGKGPGFYLDVSSATTTQFEIDSIQLR